MRTYKLTPDRVPIVAKYVVSHTELRARSLYWDHRNGVVYLTREELPHDLVGTYDYRTTPNQVAEDLYAIFEET